MATAEQATAARGEAHRQHLLAGGESVPDEMRAELFEVANDLSTAAGRDELMGVIEAAYSLVGRWEDFLNEGVQTHG